MKTTQHPSDEEFKERAFAAYRQEHGIHETTRLGDLPLKTVREVLQAAQRLKDSTK
jgi:hypothetical protein